MNTLKIVLRWIFGLSILLFGLASIDDSFLIAFTSIILGLFLLPPILKVIEKKVGHSFSTISKWAITLGGLALVIFAISSKQSAENKKADKIVEEASILIDQDKMRDAKAKIEEAKSQYVSSENKATLLEEEIENAKSLDFINEQLVALTEEEFKRLQQGSLDKKILTQKTLNEDVIFFMETQASERARLIEEKMAIQEQERIAAEAEAERARQTKLVQDRKKLVESQFSAWNGSHPALTRLIKENMNDPDSYEHVETRFRDQGSSIIVTTKFRGANAFGGKVVNTVQATVDFEGNIVEILSQY